MMDKARKAKRKQRGQVMVLGVVTMLVLAFMTMLSFNVGNAIQQKIRLQAHSDALAVSIATLEARALNYYAYSNRAIAAVLVANATLHGYHSIATLTGSVMFGAGVSFLMIAAIEFGLCCACPWCACVWHCWDGIQATFIAFRYFSQSNNWARRVRGLEGQFNQAVNWLVRASDAIHSSQAMMGVDLIAGPLTGSKGTFQKLWDSNMKCAGDQAPGLTLLNVRHYACALEGAASDFLCVGGTSRIAKEPRSKVMTNAANAARPAFDRNRFGLGPMFLHPQFINAVRQVPGSGISVPAAQYGAGGITNGDDLGDCTSIPQNGIGTTACAFDFGLHTAQWRHGAGVGPYGAFVASNEQGGDHWQVSWSPRAPHSGQHNRFRTVQRSEADPACLNLGHCFINFRSAPGSGNYYGQPRVFAAVKAKLTDLRDDCDQRQPWEVSNTGTVAIDDGQRGTASLTFKPTIEGRSISQAMVYYHRFDSWRVAPNMFDPYWRAKLHPFERADLLLALGAAADTGGLTNSAAPYEGRWP